MKRDEFFAEARTDGVGALAGVRLVELTTTWAGPMCGCLFGDLGADVIKVEMPGGEVARHVPPALPGTDPPLSFMHQTVNRNKRSVTLDLRRPEGRDLFLDLAATADVVVENFRPGTTARWGVGYVDVRGVRPDTVYVSISGYGQFGPDAEQAGYDPMAQASSGWLSLNGEPGGAPVKAPTFIGDDIAGLHAAFNALAALRHRDRTGEGQYIDVALQDALLFQSNGYLTLAALGADLPRMGSQFVIAAPAGVFAAQDGHVMAGVLTDPHWTRLTRLLGRPELADSPDYATGRARVARRSEVNEMVAAWIGARSVADVVAELLSRQLPVSEVRTFHSAAADPHVRAREMLVPTRVEGGAEIPLVGPAAKLSRTPAKIRTGAPALGADNESVFAELGLDEAAIAALRVSGAI